MKKISYVDLLAEKINREREQFKQEYMNKQPKEVYEDWYKICFYESYYEMLTSDFTNDRMDIIEWLCNFENPLGFLYEEWLVCDDAFSGSWDDMLGWLDLVQWQITREED